MNQKLCAISGFLSGILFWVSYFIFSSIRPEYFHKYKAVSELGSVNAPNALLWNIFGFGFVGVLLCVFAVGLYQSVQGKKAFYFLFLVGFFWLLNGVFPGDFENKTSTTMILHAIASLGGGLFFVIAVFAYVPSMRASEYWRSSVMPSVIICIAFIISGFLRSGSAPALGQKIGFLIFFIWVFFMAFKLYRAPVNKAVNLTATS